MAQKKTRAARGEAPERRAFTVALEDLHAKFDVFGEALQLVRSDVTALRADVAALQPLPAEVAALRSDAGGIRRDVDLLKIAVVDSVREIKQLGKAP